MDKFKIIILVTRINATGSGITHYSTVPAPVVSPLIINEAFKLHIIRIGGIFIILIKQII